MSTSTNTKKRNIDCVDGVESGPPTKKQKTSNNFESCVMNPNLRKELESLGLLFTHFCCYNNNMLFMHHYMQ